MHSAVKARIPLIILSILVSSLSLQPAGAQEKTLKPIIAVLDFKISGIEKSEVDVFIDYLSSHFIQSGAYRVIDRARREMLLSEIELSVSDVSDERYQLEIGKQLSANKIVVGSLGRVGDRYLLTMKLIDVSTAETENSVSQKYDSFNSLIDDSRDLAFLFVGRETEIASREKPVRQPVRAETPTAVTAGTASLTGDTTGPLRVRSGSALEAGLGYYYFTYYEESAFSVKAGYMYQFNNWISAGLEVSGVFANGISFFPVAVKAAIGNKVDGFAFLLAAGLENFTAGLYFRNFIVDLTYYKPESQVEVFQDSLGLSVGYSLYFGR